MTSKELNSIILNKNNRGIFVITGIMAAGKSTVAQLLAERLDKCVHIHGDIFRTMIVTGREEMSPNPSDEALKQLSLRYKMAATTANTYFEAGFNVVVQDNIYGPELTDFVNFVSHRPLYVIVLCPRTEIVSKREAERGKNGYGTWSPAVLDNILRNETPKIGMWLDSSELTPEETVDEILSRAWKEGQIY
jgi:chloramphenicol 3-O-phosphotransferase